MDLLDDPELKKTYDKCKYIVKLWEHKFIKKNKRVPSKLDIREASTEVRHAYQKYFQLKTAALEQSFMDVDGFDDDNIDNNSCSSDITATLGENSNKNDQSFDDLKPHPKSPSPDKDKNISEVTSEIPEDVWGSHLSNVKRTDDLNVSKTNTNELEESVVKSSITKKLFVGSKFTKRNPRKSLSFSQKKSESNIDSQMFFSQPIVPVPQESFSSQSEETISFSQPKQTFNNITENVKIITPSQQISSQSTSIIQSFLQNSFRPLKSVDTGWMERVAQNTGTTFENPDLIESEDYYNVSNKVASNLPNMNSFPVTNKQYHNDKTTVDYDSEDIIEDSDEEDTLSQSLHIAKKIRLENTLNNFKLNNTPSIPNKSLNEVTNTESLKQITNIVKEIDSVSSLETQNVDVERMDDGVNISSIENIEEKIVRKCRTPNRRKNGDLNEEPTPKKTAGRKKKVDVNEDPIPKKSPARTLKAQVKTKTPSRKSNNTAPVEESPSRRSTRKAKPLVSFKELSDDEVDPFHSDTDSKDPEFMAEEHSKYTFHNEDEENSTSEVSSNVSKKKSPIRKRTSKKKQKETAENNEDTEETGAVYELEYSIKPRVVAPRFSSIKNALKTAKPAKKRNAKDDVNSNDKKETDSSSNMVKNKRQQEKEKFEKKIASGTLNENFVTINLRKKIYARGKKGMNFSKYKKMQWKNKKKALCGPDMDMGGCDGGMLTCFNCGQIGHFAQNCKAEKACDSLLPLTADVEEDCPFPTLEEASQMAKESSLSIRKPKLQLPDDGNSGNSAEDGEDDSDNEEDVNDCFDDLDTEKLMVEAERLEEHVKKLDVQMYMDNVKSTEPYYKLKEDNSIIDTPTEVFETLKLFGHTSFRPGQEQAVMRILSGKSTLVTLSTGSGKSLCYQIPAYLYAKRERCISLIISPLVSLMEDQVTGIPSFLRAACLHTNQSKTQKDKIKEAIADGNLDVLLISPEAVVAGEKSNGFGSVLRKLPPIAFACIDEAHCVSQWSHNFRPSYLMICRVLRERLGVTTVLGLTATATRATSDSIINHLQIPDGRDGIISDIPLPDNLSLTVSKDAQRDHALLGLLLSDKYKDCKSIIVYCTRRDECERIATFLRTCLKNEKVVENSNKKRKRVNLQAEPYHAGLSGSRRKTIQKTFMSGDLKIVVATVAFGMGINKSDIRAVIHYNMPKNFESYVQEVGRAGRDGLPAYCHLFLDSQGKDENELRRHIHANSIDRHVIRKLLQRIFIPCSCKNSCPKHEVGFSIEETVRALDIPEENISTLLCYLELHPNNYVELLSPAYTICKVISYGGPLQIRRAAKDCPPLAMALALHKTKEGGDPNVLEFPVIDVAAAIGWESGICKHKLKNLEWITVNNQPKRSNLSVRFSNLGFRLFAPGNLTDDQLDEALDNLHTRVVEQEKTAILQLRAVHKTLVDVATPTYRASLEDQSNNDKLKMKVREYFYSPDPLKSIEELESPKKVNEEQLVKDIRATICMYRDNTFTGRAIARIFHGIQSPNYPAVIWGRSKFWRSHTNEDYHTICRIATREILNMRTLS